jgi:drug/metabolite transporter (DMT)-like permease
VSATPGPRRRSLFTPLDGLLLLMTIIWGTNFSVIKSALRELDAQAFNALRMAVASLAFLAVMALARLFPSASGSFHSAARVTTLEWWQLAGLGFVGHVLYQFCFIGGLARTSVANSSLMLATTPVVIMVITAALRYERVTRMHWFGAAVSMAGIYLVVGRGFTLGGERLLGDLLMFGAVCCWAVYTLGARPLMARHSPVGVTGLSMALGTVVYVAAVWTKVAAADWARVSAWTYGLIVYSALFALCIAYTIWYIAVRQIGSARTSAYSNLIPVVAMGSAVLFLHEPLDIRKVVGAAAVLAGVALTRAGSAPAIPAEE